MQPNKVSRRHFTEAARAAALVARRLKREKSVPFGTPEVFVARATDAKLRFVWEFRRFGGIVVTRSACTYATAGAARSAGREVLEQPRGPA